MQILQSIFKQVLATLIFFTRLPFWRICDVEKEYYERVVPYWPLAGWLTGGIMALVFWLANMVLPLPLAIVLALVSRVLITGALHEDGFADFCDGFGGGTSRERTLEIMKDSHIGTYGVLGLVLYYIIMYNALLAVQSSLMSPFLFVIADTICKYFSSMIVYFLPYARKETEAKNRLVYSKVTLLERIISLFLGILPIIIFCPIAFLPNILYAIISVIITIAFLFTKMNSVIQGYTGDCCGATFVITESIFYITLLATFSL